MQGTHFTRPLILYIGGTVIRKLYRVLQIFYIIFALSTLSINASVILVNSSGDDPAVNPALSPLTAGNEITLRSAIQYANAQGGSTEIDFNILSAGPAVINVGTGSGVTGQALPVITNELIINGYTQPNSAAATKTANANIQVILNGSAVNSGVFQDGLTLNAGSSNSVIKGLVIQAFPQNGINIQDGTGQSIIGNYIGTDRTGAIAVSNLGNGIYVGLGVTGVTVGSVAILAGIPGDRNIISGQQFTTGAMPISGAGVFIEGSNNNIIGNYIGTDVSGKNALSNRTGVYVYSAVPIDLNNSIQNNIIAFNNGAGIGEGSGVTIDGANNNSILSNSIFSNSNFGVVGNGITLINNGNNNLGFPTLTSGTISGTTLNLGGNFSSLANPNSKFIVQFFVNPAVGSTTQNQTFVGKTISTTDVNGNATFSNIRLFSNAIAKQQVSATITLLSSAGIPLSTSPYSLNFILAQGQAAGAIDTSITFDAFPGIRAQTVVIDSAGRVIVGGLEGSIVRYNLSGVIDLTYTAFPGIAIKDMVIDVNDNIVAVGSEGFVVRYNPNGEIDLVFDAFPGVLSNAVIFDVGGDVIVGGLQSTIVRYFNSGANDGAIDITFDAFPGTEVNDLALDSFGQIIACGLQGTVVRYSSDGTLDIAYDTFPGVAANAIAVDSSDRAIVVGKTKVTTILTNNVVGGLIPAVISTTLTNVVRYDTDGTIDLTFSAFSGLDAQDIILDLNANAIVCGLESLVVQYASSTGAINFTFAPFPGISATRLALTTANQIVAVGWEGDVVRYYN